MIRKSSINAFEIAHISYINYSIIKPLSKILQRNTLNMQNSHFFRKYANILQYFVLLLFSDLSELNIITYK